MPLEGDTIRGRFALGTTIDVNISAINMSRELYGRVLSP